MKRSWKEAWLTVAEAFGNPDKTPYQKSITQEGLCAAFDSLWGRGSFAFCSLSYWNDDAEKSGDYKDGYWFPTNQFGDSSADEIRCLFACLFAAMTQEEFDEVFV